MRRNALFITVGGLLMAASFVGVFWVGQVVNPPGVSLVVAGDAIAPGTRLADLLAVAGQLRVDDRAQLSPETARTLLTEGDIGHLADGVIVQAIAAGQPIPLTAISSRHNPVGAAWPALLLTDPDLVAMAIPVGLTTMPRTLRNGDFVDIIFGSGGAGARAPLLPTSAAAHVAGDGRGLSQTEYEAALAHPPTDAPSIPDYLPIAKTIVTNAQVLDVVLEGESGEAAAPVALVVLIPRDAQEIVQFAADNGSLRVTQLAAVLNSETTPVGTRHPSLGMTWNDLVALLDLEREARLRDGPPADVFGPGATAILPLLPGPPLAESR